MALALLGVLFEQAATGPQVLAAGQIVGNPHKERGDTMGPGWIVVLYAM